MRKQYALYKGENLIQIGTVKEIAEAQNIKEKTVYFRQTPTYLKRMEKSKKGNYKVLVRLDDEE